LHGLWIRHGHHRGRLADRALRTYSYRRDRHRNRLGRIVTKYWLERIARISVEIDIASEFRYRAPAMPKGGAAIFVSQSGETADTLAALRYAKAQD
jgi:hypothetical protein